MSGLESLDDFIARVRAMKEFPRALAKEAEQAVADALRSTVAAGTDPDGNPWKPKKDGGRALVNAAKAITVRARDTVIRATIGIPEAFHHYGTKRDPQRRILPDGGAGVPPLVGAAVRRVAATVFRRMTKGGG